MITDTLAEPAVLATAKEYLFEGGESGYAVVDAQFSRSAWGAGDVSTTTAERLRPINALQMRNGRPDALIAPPREETYNKSKSETDPIPLAVLEAKGETSSSDSNKARVAITQAHAHLEEVNLGYAAVPQKFVSKQARTLARELNIGLLAVDNDDITLLERPRIVGAETSETAETFRFHAHLTDIAVESLKKNHPKNAVGYALAVQHSDDPDSLFKQYVIKSVDDARRDATALGLVREAFGQTELTKLGREAVRTIRYHHNGILPALESIQAQTGSPARFIDELPVMGTTARQTLLSYPPTQVLINTLSELAAEGHREPSLAQVAKRIASERPGFALDLFVSPKDRSRVFSGGGDGSDIDPEVFEEGSIYSTHTTFQYKAMLYHVGLLTERGEDTKSDLQPDSAIWALETPL